ncbi:CocE/NonD family hydrolase [Maribacter hydrothermalis]|uniref:Peptidase S15 n=1 Tax=Maribacter hydrothermalis TaxID=1836467 RepID=A0A1B7ZD83_9FLAO|nr:CocE/NonD family hydrolase [Maribacter hydrothermalis]APQ18797.1 peptidase S15 [Maribacter hydrothermalis]OBR41041.1 peptidase S15 [Maribacter hydrothermalis]
MKIILHLFIFLLIGCNASSQKKETSELDGEYNIQDVLIETRDGAKVSVIIVRKNEITEPKPVILQSTIYVRDKGGDLNTLKESANKGYIGVIAYTRGKRLSPNEIWPYENDGNDTYDVIDWISKQKWCDGRIGMFGGSYNGFTQWASTKKLHPALKTIVPYVANRPGMGLPMENNVFINPNYEWAFYVGNNKTLDTIAGNDRQRSRDMQNKWWENGIAYKKLDSIDERPNKWFQRWISHPSFDDYWQSMAPYKEDFSQIDIPVLSIDGYYNDSQNSGLYYLREHYKYNPQAEHYLIIGPYGHFGAQKGGFPEVNGYKVDADALINTNEITYQWFDYIFKNGKKPEKLKDKINYQVMGANEWRSASSITEMSNKSLKLYLTKEKVEDINLLSPEKPVEKNFHFQEVDFSNREIWNNDYYPDPIIRDYRDMGNGFNFISKPLEESIIVNGSFIGQLKVSINKKDFDFGVTLYEVMPNGEYFSLSYIIGRASYADDITKRKLLEPNKIETIRFSNTHLVSKKLSKGSRLLVYINVNKNPFSELNYGTGKKVAEENIKDAKEPLKIKWYNDSFVEIPIWKD